MKPNFFTPLRYPGGKAGLGQWVAYLMRSNGVSGGTYIEPYAGGAGVALYLLLNEYVEKIIINDIDPIIHSFWWSVINDTEKLIEKIKCTPVDVETWLEQREISKRPEEHDHLSRGFSAFFLNRSNRSGIIKGGVIGGIDQTGKYKIDARFNKDDLIKRIERIAQRRKSIKLLNIDALKLIEENKKYSQEKSLIYLDPPYFNKGSQLYKNFYLPKDHQLISEAISSTKTPWMVTYDNCKEIQDLYKKESSLEFSLTYSTALSRPIATEIMVYGNMSIPKRPEISKSIRPYPRKWDLVA